MEFDKKKLFYEIEKKEKQYLAFWETICNMETISQDKKALDELADYIQHYALEEGFTVLRTPFEKCGDF